jgi:uncharacterized C2H2 Zn-finger protein
MKDPCIECMVHVNCSKICKDRENYTALCNDAAKYYKSHKAGGFNFNLEAVRRYSKDFTQSFNKQNEAWTRNRKILGEKK